MCWNVFSPALPQRRALTVRIAPVFVDARANLGARGRQVEASDDDVLALGSPGHAAAGQHAGRRKHDALDRSARRRRPGRVGVVGVKQRHAPEQAALGAAGAGSPREDRPSTVCSAVNGNQRPTLMRPLIAIRTPPGSAAPSLMAWLK
jgi:hypothetical protein